jgi:hypothetical protein
MQIDTALGIDPYNAFLHGFNGVDLLYERRWDEAAEELRAALKLSPGLPFAAQSLVAALHANGDRGAALDALRAYAAIMGYAEVDRAMARRRATDPYSQVVRQAADALADRARTTYVAPYDLYSWYTYAGALDRAFEWVEKGFEVHDAGLPYLGEPDLEPLFSDPRHRDAMRRLNLSR